MMRPSLLDRVRVHFPAKIAVWFALAVGIYGPYFILQRVHLFPARVVPATFLDEWISFNPNWVFAYLSIALLVLLAPLLSTRREELTAYVRGLIALCLPCFAIFALLPVAGPRPEVLPDHAVYRWLVGIDTAWNSMPSLHAGLAAYSLRFADGVICESLSCRERFIFRVLALIWVASIIYAALTTKQHWVLDMPPGLAAGWLAHRIAVGRGALALKR